MLTVSTSVRPPYDIDEKFRQENFNSFNQREMHQTAILKVWCYLFKYVIKHVQVFSEYQQVFHVIEWFPIKMFFSFFKLLHSIEYWSWNHKIWCGNMWYAKNPKGKGNTEQRKDFSDIFPGI